MGEGRVHKLAHLYIFLAKVRHTQLERHLSAKYIEQRRCFYKYQYNSHSTTKLRKIISLAFLLFLQRAVKIGNKRQKPDFVDFAWKSGRALSPNTKKISKRILFTNAFKIDQPMLIWPFYVQVHENRTLSILRELHEKTCPALIRKGRRSRRRPHITIEVE